MSKEEPDTDAVKLLWPANLPSFKDTLYEHHAQLLTLARRMVKTFALALHLDENYFDRYIEEPSAAMRITHYPQQDVSSGLVAILYSFPSTCYNVLIFSRHLHPSNSELELTLISSVSHSSHKMSTPAWKCSPNRDTG
jgi:hypothetical protein